VALPPFGGKSSRLIEPASNRLESGQKVPAALVLGKTLIFRWFYTNFSSAETA
jgi:hypothetical protein